ncbi:MAG TPA: chemotaxis protein CheA [Rhodocyclaceae bacterium]|nr:chemotaxis protein CheA [Rhodocyclaceae bacterium]
MEEILQIFVHEARDQLGELEAGLMRLEQGEHDPELINAIFRAAHTVKGGAGVVELKAVEGFTHSLENVLDLVRNNELALSSALIAVLLACSDHLLRMLDKVEAGQLSVEELASDQDKVLLDQLAACLGAAGALVTTDVADSESFTDEPQVIGVGLVANDAWHVSVRFGRDVLRKGMEPLSFLRYLGSLGEIVQLVTVLDAMPLAEEMDPESCYLGFEINLRCDADKASIERVFDFVRDDCELAIIPPHSLVEQYIALIESLPEENMKLGEILVKCGALTHQELEAGLLRQQTVVADDVEQVAVAEPPRPLGEILVQRQAVKPEVVEAAVKKQKQVSEKKAAEARLIRVQADKLDQLIDLVGELVIAGASTNLMALRSGQMQLVEATSILNRLVEDIRGAALQLRMVQIGETFNRYHRVVREIGKELGKDVELVIEGGETELDKSVVEKIGDPLMHLVRNAMDHGIEKTSVRLDAGKEERGHVVLNAYHDSGSIVIEVSDDGSGIDAERVRAKALERGLINAGQTLSEQEIINLLFEPGFSTAETVSSISGRGVGMDVVRKSIQALRGTVDVRTELGVGTCFTVRLPLTLAIIDGFLVGVNQAFYVIPLASVVECLELQEISDGCNYLNLRGEVLPFVRLRQLFQVPGPRPRRESVVVVRYAGRRIGIVVDELRGEFQTVIKPLASLFSNVRGIGGSTILGSGEVALIVDVQMLIEMCVGDDEKSEAANAQLHRLAMADSTA